MIQKRLYLCLISLNLFLLIATGATASDDEAGRVKATQCAVCHGTYGEGNGIPGSSIAGMDERLFKKHLHDFKSGMRRNYMMEMFANRLSDEDIEILAAYFATK